MRGHDGDCDSAFPRAKKRSHSEIEKHGDDDGGGEKRAVVGAVGVAEACAPEGGGEDDHREQEEDACDFKQDDGAGAVEWLEEASYGAGDAAAAAGCGTHGGGRGGPGLRDGCGLRCGLGGGGKALACDTPGDA